MPRIAHLAAEGRRHRLVEQRQAVLGPPESDVMDAELAQRADLEVEVLQLTRDRERPLVVALGLLRRGCAPRALHFELDLWRADGKPVEQPLGAVEPTAGRSRVAVRARVLDRQPDRDRAGPGGIAGAAKPRVGLLAQGHARVQLAEEPEHLAEPVARVGVLALLEQALEKCLGALPVALLESGPCRLTAGRRRARLHGPRAYCGLSGAGERGAGGRHEPEPLRDERDDGSLDVFGAAADERLAHEQRRQRGEAVLLPDRSGNKATVMKLTVSSSGRAIHGTGGSSTIWRARSRAQSLTNSRSPSSILRR